MMTPQTTAQPIIEINHLKNYLGDQWVHEDVNLAINPGEIIAIVGGSGTGKTTLLRCLLMLLQPTEGSIKIFGTDILNCSTAQALAIRHRWGMMFQQGALFSSLSVLENVMFPLQVFTQLAPALIKKIALLKISLAGLPLSAINKYPAELSGGMLKRAALARAIILDPELLFLDEPTAGLDPKSASGLDELVLELRSSLGLTIVMVTHDLDTLWRVPDRVAFLGEGKVLAALPMSELTQQTHPLIKEYFNNARGRVQQDLS